jgi:two-component system, chemotaxis family, sensor kinase Cph1
MPGADPFIGIEACNVSDAQTDHSRLAELAANLGLHQHLCLIYETPEEQFAAALPYLRTGLERGEKCLYVGDENSVAESWMLCAEARLPSIISCASA